MHEEFSNKTIEQVHHDAVKFINEENSLTTKAMNDNIYKLLIKNVSKNDPLSEEEAQVS